MGRPIRRHEPGQFHLVTTRCHQGNFLLRPDELLNALVLEWLARAKQRFPSLRIFAVCVMSNHLHLLVRDDLGILSEWCCYLLGHLARGVNSIRGITGACFERRYSAEPVLDEEALLDRLVYVVTNPVKAGLCKRASDWPGVVLFAADAPLEVPVTWVSRERQVEGKVVIDPLPRAELESRGVKVIEAAIQQRESEFADDRRRARRKTLNRQQILSQSFRSSAKQLNRSPRPVCHASDPVLKQRFIEGYREFLDLYRDASERLRSGRRRVTFPNWCYPPGLPMVRAVGSEPAGAG